jgi:hypothetical protein
MILTSIFSNDITNAREKTVESLSDHSKFYETLGHALQNGNVCITWSSFEI